METINADKTKEQEEKISFQEVEKRRNKLNQKTAAKTSTKNHKVCMHNHIHNKQAEDGLAPTQISKNINTENHILLRDEEGVPNLQHVFNTEGGTKQKAMYRSLQVNAYFFTIIKMFIF